MTRRSAGVAVLAAVLGATALAALLWFNPPLRAAAIATAPAWKEVSWPFPVDQWGRGKAFRCKAASCGAEVTVYVRAKIGFCNCSTGVADDEDLDRMGDLVLIGDQTSPLASGHPITIAWMKGRSRSYGINARGPANTVISIVYNERCDMIAAMAVVDRKEIDVAESKVIEFLNSGTVMRWAEAVLGL